MPLRTDIVVLQDTRRVEEVDEGLCLLSGPRYGLGQSVVGHRVAEVGLGVEHGDHVANLVDEALVGDGRECVAGALEAEPEGLGIVSQTRRASSGPGSGYHYNDLCVRILSVNPLDELG